ARPDIHKDYPSGDPRQSNSVWNAATKTVSLRAARNEFVAFQVVVETDSHLNETDLRVSPLAGPGGAVIGDKYVAPFKEWYVEVRRPTTGYERLSLGA